MRLRNWAASIGFSRVSRMSAPSANPSLTTQLTSSVAHKGRPLWRRPACSSWWCSLPVFYLQLINQDELIKVFRHIGRGSVFEKKTQLLTFLTVLGNDFFKKCLSTFFLSSTPMWTVETLITLQWICTKATKAHKKPHFLSLLLISRNKIEGKLSQQFHRTTPFKSWLERYAKLQCGC